MLQEKKTKGLQKYYAAKLFILMGGVSMGGVLLSLATLSFAESTEEQAALTKQQLKKINTQIVEIKNELGKDKHFQKKEQDLLKKVEIELGVLHKKSRSLKQRKKSTQEEIAILKKQEAELIEKNQQQQKALRKDLQAIYKLGKQEKLKLFLNQEDPQELARTLKYYDYYTAARVERILSYQSNIKDLEAKRKEIEKQLLTLQGLQEKINQQANELTKLQANKHSILAKVNETIRSKDQQLKSLHDNQTRLGKLLQSLQGIWADLPSKLSQTPFHKHKGKFNYPANGPIKHSFASQRAGGRMKWNGWLIGAPENTNVKAIHDGRVVFSDWIRGYGLLIIVDHSDGYLSLYGHNASLIKETGDWIHGGETLATVGNSGGQNETGLYFEIRRNGKPLNPALWLKQ